MGLNPDLFSPLSKRYLQVFLYVSETDRAYESLMLLVDGVITVNGGNKSHAFKFCHDSELPVMTGVGQVKINNRDLRTGDGLVFDASSGFFSTQGTRRAMPKNLTIPMRCLNPSWARKWLW